MKVYRIEDEEEHWVAAKHPGRAVEVLAESFGYESRADYLVEHEPETTEVPPHESVRVRLDFTPEIPEHEAKHLPEGVRAEQLWVSGPASAWASEAEGVIASTVY